MQGIFPTLSQVCGRATLAHLPRLIANEPSNLSRKKLSRQAILHSCAIIGRARYGRQSAKRAGCRAALSFGTKATAANGSSSIILAIWSANRSNTIEVTRADDRSLWNHCRRHLSSTAILRRGLFGLIANV